MTGARGLGRPSLFGVQAMADSLLRVLRHFFQVGLGALMLLVGRTGPTLDGSKFGRGVVALISTTLTAFDRGFRGSTPNSCGASVSKVLVRRSIVAKQKFSLHAFDDGS
jgi:hypothetical protein